MRLPRKMLTCPQSCQASATSCVNDPEHVHRAYPASPKPRLHLPRSALAHIALDSTGGPCEASAWSGSYLRVATARHRNYASQAAPLQPRAPRLAPRRAGSRLLIAALVRGRGAAPAGRTRALGALRLLGRTFRFGMGTSKGENLGQEGTVGVACLKHPGPPLSVLREDARWCGARPSIARSGLHPSCGCAGWQGTAPGGRGCVWVLVAFCPAAPQPLSAAVHAQMLGGRGLHSLGATELGFSTLGFVSHFLLSGEPVCDKLCESRASRSLI